MKRKIFAALVAVVMVVSMLPMSVMAADATFEVSTSEQLMKVIATAENATGAITIQLNADITLSDDIVVKGGNVTIVGDNDGSTITAESKNTDIFTVNGGTLTLGKNLKAVSDTAIIYVQKGTLTVDGAEITVNMTDAYAGVYVENGTFEMKSGKITQSGENQNTLYMNLPTASAIVSGGEIISKNSSAIAVNGGSSLTISGGTVETTIEDPTYCAAYAMGGGKIVMTDGIVSAAAGRGLVANIWDTATGGTVEMSGGTVKGGIASHEDATCTFTVTGGAVIGPICNDGIATLTISGGFFTVDPSEYVADGKVVETKNGVYGVFDEIVEEEKPEPKFDMPRLNLRSIVIDTTEGGKTSVASGRCYGAIGSTHRLTLTPDEGYEIGEVLVNGKAVEVNKNNKISFVVKGNTYVEVEFVEIED